MIARYWGSKNYKSVVTDTNPTIQESVSNSLQKTYHLDQLGREMWDCFDDFELDVRFQCLKTVGQFVQNFSRQHRRSLSTTPKFVWIAQLVVQPTDKLHAFELCDCVVHGGRLEMEGKRVGAKRFRLRSLWVEESLACLKTFLEWTVDKNELFWYRNIFLVFSPKMLYRPKSTQSYVQKRKKYKTDKFWFV